MMFKQAIFIFLLSVTSPIVRTSAADVGGVGEEQVCHPGDDTCNQGQGQDQAVGGKDNGTRTGTVVDDGQHQQQMQQGVYDDDYVYDENDIKNKDMYDDDDDDFTFDEDDDDGYNQFQAAGEGNGPDSDSHFDDFGDFENDDGQEQHKAAPCEDTHELCQFWAEQDECIHNPNYMLQGCKKSCNACGESIPALQGSGGGGAAKKVGPGSTYGEIQEVEGPHKEAAIKKIAEMDKYMAEVVSTPEYDSVRAQCTNRHAQCAFWAVVGECEKNPSYMKLHCPPVCESCHLLEFDVRCPKDENAVDVFGPGDLNKMFERIVATEEHVIVHSRPEYAEGDNQDNATHILGPWVITVDNFIKDDETARLIELGGDEGYERSTDVGKKLFDGSFDAKQSKTRTSENAWCNNECHKDPLAKSAIDSIERLTGVPEVNSEYLQLLKYEKGQFYRRHHDYIDQTWDRPPGPRILTAFLYLNDVEAGGGTNFPGLNLTIMPKKGRILLWPSVRDEDPNLKDYRTDHQALDVEKGRKFAANAWLHLRDFKTPHDAGCS